MSWGLISASADTPAKLETALKDEIKSYFDQAGFEELDDKGGRQQAKAAAKAARQLAEGLDIEGTVEVRLAGHVRRGEPGAVPSAISINLIELNPPHIEHADAEDEQNQAEDEQNQAENGQN